jgi:hypothetical protein
MNRADINKLYALMFTEYPDIVGIKDLQKMLGIGRNLAYALVSNGYIKGITVGNKLRIPKINVINYALEIGA